MNTSPRCFISYSWDDDAHKDWVKDLAEKLRLDGVTSILDRWHAVPGDQLPAFMEKEIRESDYVLIICSQNYKVKSDNRTGGVGYEGDIITAEIFVNKQIRKFIPILRKGSWRDAAPSYLLGKYYIDLSNDNHFSKNYEDLLLTLYKKREAPPAVGSPPSNLLKEYAQRQKQIDRLQWVNFEAGNFPVLSDSNANRQGLLRQIRNTLIDVFKDAYISFASFLFLKHHTEGDTNLTSYVLIGHQREFIHACQENHRNEMVRMITLKMSENWDKAKEELKSEYIEREKVYSSWQLIHDVHFFTEPSALLIEYDPKLKRIKFSTDLEKQTDPGLYDHECQVTSEAIRYTCAMLQTPHANIGDIGHQLGNLPLLKLTTDFIDRKQISLTSFRCQLENPENWDYVNRDLQGKFSGYD